MWWLVRGTEIAEYPAHGFFMVVIPGYLYQDLLSLGDWVGEKAQGFKTRAKSTEYPQEIKEGLLPFYKYVNM